MNFKRFLNEMSKESDFAMLALKHSGYKILVNTDGIHYKYWAYKKPYRGKCDVIYGRIGKTEVNHQYDSCDLDDKIREKLKKGYREMY